MRKALYHEGDWCFLVTKTAWPVLRMELDSLLRRGGVYFSVYEKTVKKKDDEGKLAVILYFEDNILDLMAEILKIKCRMSNYNIYAEFKCYASDMFDQFNAR